MKTEIFDLMKIEISTNLPYWDLVRVYITEEWYILYINKSHNCEGEWLTIRSYTWHSKCTLAMYFVFFILSSKKSMKKIIIEHFLLHYLSIIHIFSRSEMVCLTYIYPLKARLKDFLGLNQDRTWDIFKMFEARY